MRKFITGASTRLSSVSNYCIYADLIGFDSPLIVTDTENRPDCILRLTGEHDPRELYIIELTVGFKTSLQKNTPRKEAKYNMLLSYLRQKFDEVFFVNLSLSALGFCDSSCLSFTDMLKHLKFTEEKRTFMFKVYRRYVFALLIIFSAGDTNHGQSLP